MPGAPLAAASVTKITAIGAENEYADVIAQVGGKYEPGAGYPAPEGAAAPGYRPARYRTGAGGTQ